jgi:hypothetical protein
VSGTTDGPGGEEPVLGTALVGPAARTTRQALSAVAFHARHADAAPRPGRWGRALWALGVTLHAAELVVTDRRLRRAALLPSLLTLAGCAVLAGIAAADEEGARGAAAFQAFLVSFVALASMPPTVLQRMWFRVAHEARRALGQAEGEDPFPGEGFAAMLWREGVKAARQAVVVTVGIFPLLVLVRLLPFGQAESALLAGAWAFYWVVVDAFELPIEVVPGPRGGAPAPWYARLLGRAGAKYRLLRPLAGLGRWLDRLTRPWHEEVRFTERHAVETVAFGAVVGTVLLIPVAGLFFRAVAITAATALLGRLGMEPPLPPPPLEDGPPPLG